MTLEVIKIQWNKNLKRLNKAEKVALEDPELFERFTDEYNSICREMSSLMKEYENATGEPISESIFDNGFDLS